MLSTALTSISWLIRYNIASMLARVKPPQTAFLTVLHNYIDKRITERRPARKTIEKYNLYLEHMELYLQVQHRQNIPAEQVTIAFLEKFRLWLHKYLQRCSMTHSSRHLEFYRAALGMAVRMEQIEHNRVTDIETRRDPVPEVVALDLHEFTKLTQAGFSQDVHQLVADLFIFQCSTGLSYGDLQSFEISRDRSGIEWISAGRVKNGTPFYVPLFPSAKQILKKYRGQLPAMSNASYNRRLKEVAILLGIKKHLTTHTGRKTFATLMYDDGWSSETVQRMLGHTTVKTTERHYIRPSKKRIERELLNRIQVLKK